MEEWLRNLSTVILTAMIHCEIEEAMGANIREEEVWRDEYAKETADMPWLMATVVSPGYLRFGN